MDGLLDYGRDRFKAHHQGARLGNPHLEEAHQSLCVSIILKTLRDALGGLGLIAHVVLGLLLVGLYYRGVAELQALPHKRQLNQLKTCRPLLELPSQHGADQCAQLLAVCRGHRLEDLVGRATRHERRQTQHGTPRRIAPPRASARSA